MINIYTHCDSFHADELMAIALLARFHFDVCGRPQRYSNPR